MSVIKKNKTMTQGLCILVVTGILSIFSTPSSSAELKPSQFNVAGWLQYGSIVKSSDTLGGKVLEGRTIISSGAQIELHVNPSPALEIQAGLGAAAGHSIAASSLQQGGYAPININPYVSNANFKYSFYNEERSGLFVKGGLFAYDYNPEAQNLGLYLLRGPVYPGYVLSGFETKAVLPISNTLGFQVHHQIGNFNHDVLFTFESEFYPYWDMSPAYIANYNFGKVFRIGAGVNFYHLIPIDSKLTKDSSKIYIDTSRSVVNPDTTIISFAGTKVMANASLDIKELVGGISALGQEDLKVYGEVALIGLDNSKAYKDNYGTYSNRMPMMVGVNLPAFKVLDKLSFEMEMYSARFQDDITQYNPYGKPSPLPASKLDTNYAADNIKWSLYASKVVQNHVKLSLQVASDHYRPGIFKGYGDNNPPSMEAIFAKPSEWYWMGKVVYFF